MQALILRSISRRQLLRYTGRHRRNFNSLQISDEVRKAVLRGKPVVALESTIYTHGFPYPENENLAIALEQVVRDNGGIPATIGILNGIAKVGMTPAELMELAEAAGKEETMKVSRRDLPYILGMGIAGRKITGGTTISGTMILAAKAGIHVFGTGGLGGVHRGGENSLDISADLTELGRTRVCVVSSGCKSFLDIPRTLEYLETQGAVVATFADGRTGDIDFPAFWTRDSGVKSPAVIQNEYEAAAIIFAQRKLTDAGKSGMLFANPIPVEHSIPKAEMDIAINAAIQEANEKGFYGHRNTPFILAKIKELTEGKSVPANKALAESNVAVATRIAVELSKLWKADKLETEKLRKRDKASSVQVPSSFENHEMTNKENRSPSPVSPDVVVFGSVAMDLACNFQPYNSSELSPRPHTSNPASFEFTAGGVGNNVANAISKIMGPNGPTVQLRSFVGDDVPGNTILAELKSRNQLTSGIEVLAGRRTAQYVSINDAKKDMVLAMADMSILDVPELSQELPSSPPPKHVVIDANWPANVIAKCVKYWKDRGSTIIFEPVSTAKSASLLSWQVEGNKRTPSLGIYPNHHVDISSPNEHELAAMYAAAKAANFMESPDWFPVIDALGIPMSGARDRFQSMTTKELVDSGIPQQTIQLLPFIPTILTKLGPAGVLMTELLGPDDERLVSEEDAPYILSRCNNGGTVVGGVYMRHFPAIKVEAEDVVSVNGAGDTFLGVVVGGLASGAKLDERLIALAQEAAVLTLKSKLAVSDALVSLQPSLAKLLE